MNLMPGRVLSLALVGSLAVALLANMVYEEPPTGAVEGRVTFAENKKPFPNARVTLVEDTGSMFAEEELRVRTARTDEDGRFLFHGVEEGYYRLHVTGRAHEDTTTVVHVVEGSVTDAKLVLNPVQPYLRSWANRSVIPPSEEPAVLVSGFVTEDELEWRVARLEDDWWKGAQGASLADWVTRQWFAPLDSIPEGAKVVATGRHRIQNRDVEGAFTDRISFGALEEGLYLVRIAAGPLRSYSSVFVSSIGMIAKSDGKKDFFYVSHVETGEPVVGVEIVDLNTRARIGKTDANGTLELPSSSQGDHKWLGVIGTSAAPVYAWNPPSDRMIRLFFYTDRPIYRPGETVRFKAVVRDLVGDQYQIPANEAVHLQFSDWDSNLLGEQAYTTSASGTFSGEFALSPEVAPGGLTIEWQVGEATGATYVQLADYEKPMYEVSVKPEQKGILSGDRARFTIEAKYYFGAPAVGKKVDVAVSRRELYGWERNPAFSHEDDWYYYEDESYGDWVQDLEVTTDENGRATVTLRPETSEMDERWTVTAYVSDEGGGYGQGEASVDVLRAGVSVSVDQSVYMLQPGAETSVTALVLDLNGEPVRGANVVAEIQTLDWINRKEVVHTFARSTFQSGSNGEIVIPVRASGSDSFRVAVKARDSGGRETVAYAFYYVYGSDFDTPSGALEVITDKKTYRPGDVCTLAIRADKPGGAALVTIEGDRLYESRVVRLDRPVTLVEVPIVTAYVPNVDVQVSRIWDANYVVARAEVITDPTTRKLTVTVTPERDQARPGETVPLQIRTSVDGEPVSAELALTVVDEALYAIREDTADILREFYPRKWNQVSTSSSIEEAFLDSGPKDFAPLEVREDFKDVALWLPDVKTDENGEARVTVTFPDNLTTWRCTAVGATLDTHVGKGVGRVRVSLPLSVTVSSPSVVVEGDRFLVEATIRNDTGRAVRVNVTGSAEGAQLEGENQRFEMPNGSSRVVQWWATAGRSETAMVTVSAVSDAASDGMVQRVRVLPKGVWRFDNVSALTSEPSWTGELSLNSERTDLGELTVRVSPSIAAGLAESLDSLIDYPFGCAEQTMSRFLPAVLVQAALRDLGLPPPRRASLIPQITRDSLLRLDRMQGYQGGWGWWEGSDPDTYITSLVLEGLYLAKKNGVSVRTSLLERGADWLKSQWSQGAVGDDDEPAYAAYVLSLYDAEAARSALQRVTPRSAIDHAYLALGWHNAGDARRAAQSLDALRKAAKIQGDFASWDGIGFWNAEPTAICARALVELAPGDPLVPKAVRFLLYRREGSWWRTTRETSYVLLTLTTYLRKSSVPLEPMNLRIQVNGSTVMERSLSIGDLAKEVVVTVPNAKLKRGKNTVSVERSGGGAALIQAYLRELSASPPKSDQGLYILRDFYALETVRRPDGSLVQVTGTEPVHSWKFGDVVICKVTVDFDGGGSWVQVDVPIPSNLRVMEPYGESYHNGWTMIWSRNSVSLFKSYVAPGADVVEIRLRASSRGTATALPAVLYNMYNPTYRAYAPSVELEVGR
ncbi:MAG: hypothetical protein D6724_08195 [Armatimonadetes bacterium]|nr:MAG: hypothetical protein D6724_08195 [Armatimonadota bacterium]